MGVDTVGVDGAKSLQLLYRDAVPEFNSTGGYIREFIPVLVGVFSKEITVQVLQTDYRTVQMMAPSRSPVAPPELEAQVVSQFVGFDKPFDQRKHLVARVRVYPYSYDSTSGSYQLLSRVVFQITSVGSGVESQTTAADPLLSRALVNYDQVKNAVVAGPT
ncbi:MAG: hypothetical protein B7Z63_02345 [Ignavibacteriae bacterium 37-53-5]|nr:MAG: hypothetical protein B7Z63_02345 [Ignavibacteriae bacterium 37-53-5]